jgi:ATPase subunit of ABC transporter with duplicated ATPase domains
MLSFNNLELVLGGKTLFDDVSFMIHHHQKVGQLAQTVQGKPVFLKLLKVSLK